MEGKDRRVGGRKGEREGGRVKKRLQWSPLLSASTLDFCYVQSGNESCLFTNRNANGYEKPEKAI